MATLNLDNVQFVGNAADQKIAAHDREPAAHGLQFDRSRDRAVLYDRFNFAETISATRVVVGGGQMRQIADTAGIATLPGGSLIFVGNAPAWNDPAYIFDNGSNGGIPFNPRQACVFDVALNRNIGYTHLTISDSSTFALRHRVGIGIGSNYFDDCGDDDSSGFTSHHLLATPRARDQTAYRIAIVQSDTRGVFYYALGADFERWTLLGVNYGTKHKRFEMYPVVAAEGIVESAILGVSIFGLPNIMAKPEVTAYIDTRTPTNGAVVQSAADALHIVNPWGIMNGVTQTVGAKYEVQYRRKDASNYLFARLKVKTGQTVYLEAGRVVDGVETLYADLSGTNLGALNHFVGIQVRAAGSKVYITSLNKLATTTPLGEQDEANFVSEVGVSFVWNGENTPRCQSFPLTCAAYDAAFAPAAVRKFCAIGDSKSAHSNKWQWYLAQLAWAQNRELVSFGTTALGVGGSTLENHWKAIVGGVADGSVSANELDLMPFAPESVLFNLGANDFSSWATDGFAEQWETRLGAVLDAIHAKWPSATIYVATPWVQSAAASAVAGMAAAVGRQVAARSYCRNGHNERSWLAAGDDGDTMTTDGTHYSEAGARELAAIWSAILE